MKPKPNTATSRCLAVTAVGDLRRVPLDSASRETGLHQDLIVELTRAHLVDCDAKGPGETELFFDQHALLRLRQIAELRERQHVNLRTIKLIVQLMDRLEHAENELRFFREQSRSSPRL